MVSRGSGSAVRRVAQRIREDVLTLADGELMGSEDDLVARYNVSRPTLRQAASILAQEQLLRIRRGVGGGYFARIPNTRGVAQSAAVYLLAHATSMEEIIVAVAPIKAELAVLACTNEDEDLHQQLVDFAKLPIPEGEDRYWSFLKSERIFSRILGKMSGNQVLTLFLNILYDFCAQIPPERDVYRDHPERIRTYWSARAGMVDSILARDAEVAAVYAKRCAGMVADWMPSDIKLVPPPLPEAIGLKGSGAAPGSDPHQWVGVPGISATSSAGEEGPTGSGRRRNISAI